MTKAKTHAQITKDPETHRRKGKKALPHPSVGRLGSQRIKKRIDAAARRLPLNKKKPILTAAGNVIKDPLSLLMGAGSTAALAKLFTKSRKKSPPKPKRKPTVRKRNGGMSRVGLSPAEEARAGIMSEAARRRPRMPTPRLPVRPTSRMPTPRLPVRPTSRMPMPQRVRRRPMKKGGTVYRKLNGQVTNGNDVVSMGYRGSA